MSSYRRIIIIGFLIFASFGCASSGYGKMSQANEDLSIVLALDSERNGDFKSSLKYYNKLFFATKREDYLNKAIVYSFKIRDWSRYGNICRLWFKKYNGYW